MTVFLWLAALLIIVTSRTQNCNPLYIRLFYHPSPAPELKVDMILMFNTIENCKDSYVKASFGNSQQEYSCTLTQIKLDGPIAPYVQEYAHTCELQIDSASQIHQFKYQVFGSLTEQTQKSPEFLVQLSEESLPLMLIVTANMNLLDDDIYKNFVSAFQQLLDHRDAELKLKNPTNNYRINGIIINGGFANNFTQNNGQNYYKIMNLISQYSSRWPLMVNLGSSQMQNKEDLSLIEKSFILGGISSGSQREGMQGFRFPRKANIALVETSSQYFHKNNNPTKSFNRTLTALENFFISNQENGTEFSIVLNHYPIFCDETAEATTDSYNCLEGEQKLQPLKDLIVNSNTDLYIGAYQNNYERTFQYQNNQFLTLENSRYRRGSLISLNQGTGGQGLNTTSTLHIPNYIVSKLIGRPGFGMLSIKGNAQLKDINQTQMIQKQSKKLQKLTHKQSPNTSINNLLDPLYAETENISEDNLFLLNYKHITILNPTDLLIEDIFRIVDQPKIVKLAQRHNLKVQE